MNDYYYGINKRITEITKTFFWVSLQTSFRIAEFYDFSGIV